MFAHLISVITFHVTSSKYDTKYEFIFIKKHFQAGIDQRAGHMKL